MKRHYRVWYDGYSEGEYDSKDEAIKDFNECVHEDLDDGGNIFVEMFNEETNRWEDV